ncbi:MAG: allophanate hydrolase subunit 1 [Solirubrobacterales bacterium]|nr:allophanate hydrolase subunit 1 [Solirubrobacterales bacterium]
MSSPIAIRQAGDRSVLVELEGNDAVQRLAAGLEARRGSELEEIVPGHETLLLVWREGAPPIGAIEQLISGAELTAEPGEIELRVRYDGPDLAAVAESCGFSPEELVTRHLACSYRVGFIGFSPGFAYLLGGDPALQPPRLAEPRTRVPAGALAIAGPYSAVYPRSSPGGWNLIGSCDEPTFNEAQNPPALLTAGMAVRLVAK